MIFLKYAAPMALISATLACSTAERTHGPQHIHANIHSDTSRGILNMGTHDAAYSMNNHAHNEANSGILNMTTHADSIHANVHSDTNSGILNVHESQDSFNAMRTHDAE